jgi:hypothetical protein
MPSYGVIGMIPAEPLRPGTRYRALISATWNGTPQTWSSTFTTEAEVAVDANDDDAIVAARDQPVLLRGLVRDALKVTDGLAIITLERPTTHRVVQLQIETKPAGFGDVRDLAGKRVEAEGRLHIDNGAVRVLLATVRVLP